MWKFADEWPKEKKIYFDSMTQWHDTEWTNWRICDIFAIKLD